MHRAALVVSVATLALSVSIETSWAATPSRTLWGVHTCENWTRVREAKTDEIGDGGLMYKAYVLGFLSGANLLMDFDVLAGIKPDTVYEWMDKFCKESPKEDLASGSIKLFAELLDIGAKSRVPGKK